MISICLQNVIALRGLPSQFLVWQHVCNVGEVWFKRFVSNLPLTQSNTFMLEMETPVGVCDRGSNLSVTLQSNPQWVPWGFRWEQVLRIPMRVVKGNWNGAVSRSNRKKAGPVFLSVIQEHSCDNWMRAKRAGKNGNWTVASEHICYNLMRAKRDGKCKIQLSRAKRAENFWKKLRFPPNSRKFR